MTKKYIFALSIETITPKRIYA